MVIYFIGRMMTKRGNFLGTPRNPKKCQKIWVEDLVQRFSKITSMRGVLTASLESRQLQRVWPRAAATKAWTDWCLCKAPQATVMMMSTAVAKNKPPRQLSCADPGRCGHTDLRNSTKRVTKRNCRVKKRHLVQLKSRNHNTFPEEASRQQSRQSS